MPSKVQQTIFVALTVLLPGLAGVCSAAELSTLFTTPQEREIIDNNRYKIDRDEPAPAPVEIEADAPVIGLARESVTFEYRISGITISSEGPHTVWINSQVYEDGQSLEDSSEIKVLTGEEIKVRITAPDGQQYYATSGESLEVTYLAPVNSQP